MMMEVLSWSGIIVIDLWVVVVVVTGVFEGD